MPCFDGLRRDGASAALKRRGSTLFGDISTGFASDDVILEQLPSTILAPIAILDLSVFGFDIAAGLVSNAPQFGAGAALGTVGVVAAGTIAAGHLAVGGARVVASGIASTICSSASISGSAFAGYTLGRAASDKEGARKVASGATGVAHAGVMRSPASRPRRCVP